MNNKIDIITIKKLRDETQAPILEIKKALEKANGDFQKARLELKKWSNEKAAKKKGEATFQGIVEAYVHAGGTVGSLIVLTCQTDFVARTADFKNLAHELAMQVASMNPKDEKDLLSQTYIRDSKKTIKALVDETIAKLGENIIVKKITRFSI